MVVVFTDTKRSPTRSGLCDLCAHKEAGEDFFLSQIFEILHFCDWRLMDFRDESYFGNCIDCG